MAVRARIRFRHSAAVSNSSVSDAAAWHAHICVGYHLTGQTERPAPLQSVLHNQPYLHTHTGRRTAFDLILQTWAGPASNMESEQVRNKNARDSAERVRFTAPLKQMARNTSPFGSGCLDVWSFVQSHDCRSAEYGQSSCHLSRGY